ncbi:serine/threonine-protein kinase [Patulibacter minatonensis]|uniref:serine/threonine-protein kinase n=1 Tax=Patulibacter minatonensis TaxID=298163 RepID=UPI00047E3E2A|nr:serine/threonine-protein kinase [Patulibacter minatonensis]
MSPEARGRREPQPGDLIGGHRIERRLGAGAMGTVWLAEHVTLGRRVALKILAHGLAHDASFQDRFMREARLAARLDHPNVVAVYDAGTDDAGLWLSMRYVEGEDLRRRLNRVAAVSGQGPASRAGAPASRPSQSPTAFRRPEATDGGRTGRTGDAASGRGGDGTGALRVPPGGLPPGEAVRVLEGVAAGLDHAHSRGILHRDVKPGNVLLQAEEASTPTPAPPASATGVEGTVQLPPFGRVLLADFGLTKELEEPGELTQTGMLLGSADSVAPEQIEGRDTDGRVDVYALGSLLYVVLTGVSPFPGATMAKLYAHVNGERPRVSDSFPALRAFDAVVAAGMATDPAARPSTAGELAALARRALAQSDVDPQATVAFEGPSAGGSGRDEVRLRRPAGRGTAFGAGAAAAAGAAGAAGAARGAGADGPAGTGPAGAAPAGGAGGATSSGGGRDDGSSSAPTRAARPVPTPPVPGAVPPVRHREDPTTSESRTRVAPPVGGPRGAAGATGRDGTGTGGSTPAPPPVTRPAGQTGGGAPAWSSAAVGRAGGPGGRAAGPGGYAGGPGPHPGGPDGGRGSSGGGNGPTGPDGRPGGTPPWLVPAVVVGVLVVALIVVVALAFKGGDDGGDGPSRTTADRPTTTRETRSTTEEAPATTDEEPPATTDAAPPATTDAAPPTDEEVDVEGGGTLSAGPATRDPAAGTPLAKTGVAADYVAPDGSWRTMLVRPGNGWEAPARTTQSAGLDRVRQSGPKGRLLLVDHTPTQPASFDTTGVLDQMTVTGTAFGDVTGYRFKDGRIGSIPECASLQCVDFPLNQSDQGPGWGVLVAAPTAAEAWATAERVVRATGP